jgi:hypothetical protein
MGTSRLQTPSGARLNRGTPKASRSPRWRRQKNLEDQEKFQGVGAIFFEEIFFRGIGSVNFFLPCSAASPLASHAPQGGSQPTGSPVQR